MGKRMEFKPDKTRTDETRMLLRNLIRGELNEKICDEIILRTYGTIEDISYEYTLEDMMTLLHCLDEKQIPEDYLEGWYELVIWGLDDYYYNSSEDQVDKNREVLGFSYPASDGAMASDILRAISYAEFKEGYDNLFSTLNIPLILEDIERYRDGENLRRYRWTSDDAYMTTVRFDDSDLCNCPSETLEYLRTNLMNLVEHGDVKAKERLGYCYYGGNALYPCDWRKARDYFIELKDSEDTTDLDKCYYANTLGYIYYYGRCTDGVPEYDKALQEFTLGSAGGIYESTYKLADMYLHGYGTPRNVRAAINQIQIVYDFNLKHMERGEFVCKFADAALRMGNLCRDESIDADEYYYYTLADFAIRKRMALNMYGDVSVFSGIQKELSRIRETRPLREERSITTYYPPKIIEDLFDDHSCIVSIKPLKSSCRITIDRLPKPGKTNILGTFECYPDYGYCELVYDAKVTVSKYETFPRVDEEYVFVADFFESCWDGDGWICDFKQFGDPVFSIHGRKFVRRLPSKKKKELAACQFASVTFTPGGRAYDYICEIPGIEVGDKVVVFANGEEKEVEVTQVFKMSIADIPMAIERYNKIIRKA